MRKLFTKLRDNQEGVSTVEFALVGTLSIVFVLVVLEFTLALHYYLRLDEALRQATREAVIAPAIVDLQPLATTDFVCTKPSNSVSCSGASINAASSYDRILTAAQNVLPNITSNMLSVTYSSSGLGNATTTGGTQPLVTVSVTGYRYITIILSIIGINQIDFPDHSLSRIKAI